MANTRKISITGGGTAIVLDINPGSIDITESQSTKKYDLVGGEYAVMGEASLIEFGIDTFIPANDSEFRRSGQDAAWVVDTLKRWMRAKQKVKVQVVGYVLDFFYITSITTVAREGDRDTPVQIQFLQAKDLNKTDTTTPSAADPPVGTFTRPELAEVVAKTYILKQGDTLWDMSRRFYGTGAKWQIIADANNITDPLKLGSPKYPPGMKLVIP